MLSSDPYVVYVNVDNNTRRSSRFGQQVTMRLVRRAFWRRMRMWARDLLARFMLNDWYQERAGTPQARGWQSAGDIVDCKTDTSAAFLSLCLSGLVGGRAVP